MTLATTNNTKTYTGDGATVAFSFPYLFYSQSHIIVTVDGVVKAIATDYTVSGEGNVNGGTITFLAAPANGAFIAIQRIVPYTQETDLENFDGNPADLTEKQFDLFAMADQQIVEQTNRSILTPVGTTLTTNVISGTIDLTARVLTITSSGVASSEVGSISSTIDTIITTPTNNDFLRYNGSEWVNIGLYNEDSTYSGNLTLSGSNAFTGTNDFQSDVSITGAQLQLSKGADIASATALPILTDGNFFDVTGTTTITSINTSGKVGTQITLQFDGVLTLTHHATDLILPTGANITTAARDIAQFVEYASGDWVCTSYQRADGTSLAEASNITIGTMQTATGSETVIDFTSIPSDVKKITLSFADAGTNGTNHYLVQLGDSGGLETTGYTSSSAIIDTTPSVISNTTGFIIGNQSSSDNKNGHLMLTLIDEATNLWSSSHDFTGVASDYISTGAGSKALSATLDRIRVTTVGGTDTFDSGSKFNISYEV